MSTLQFLLGYMSNEELSENVRVVAVHAMRKLDLQSNLNTLWEVSFYYSFVV